MAKKICFAFVAFGSSPSLARALASVPAATSASFEVVVVDNTPAQLQNPGNTNSPEQMAKQAGARYLARPDNPGYGRAMNLAFLGSTAQYFVVCNPDVEFSPGAVDGLIAALERHPRPALAGPALRGEDGQPYPTGRAFPRLGIGIGHALLGWFWPTNPATRAYHGLWRAGTNETHMVDWVSGALLVTRAQTWRELDGFDESYFMFFEDVDLCWRAHQKGIDTLLVGAVNVTHAQGATWKKQPQAMLVAHHRSAYQFLSRLYGAKHYAPLRWCLRLGLQARLALLQRLPARR